VQQPRWVRLRQAGLFVLFSIVLLIPKTLALRRRRKLWNSLRVLTGLAGGLLAGGNLAAVAPLPGLGNIPLFAGVLLIVLALVVSPAETTAPVDEIARALDALVVLNGGMFRAGEEKPAAVRLYLTPDRLHVLDLRHRRLLDIPVPEIRTARVAEGASEKERKLVVEWRAGKAEFSYEGFFAEHLAEVAQRTLESRLLSKLRVLQ